MIATLQLVERHLIRRTDPRFAVLDEACFHAKNIYNAANYQLRQAFILSGKRISYARQAAYFHQADLLPDQQLPAKVVQQVLLGLHYEWDSFAAANKAYQRDPSKFRARPRLPGYKHKTKGRYVLTFTAQAIGKAELRKGTLLLSGLNVSVPTKQRQVDQVRVVPRGSHYVVEVVYTSQLVKTVTLDERLYAGVDVGVDVLAALTSNQPGFTPCLVDGRPLKSVNQFYNKRTAALRRQLPDGVHTSRRLEALTFARNRRIDSLLHLASAFIIARLVGAGIGNLVIGKNDGWKQAVQLGAHTNQQFVAIPHARFIAMLSYKAQRAGIRVVLIEESHTSKCSFLDREPIEHRPEYLGKRVARGLFRTSDGRPIQADLNGSYNIIRKAAPQAFSASASVVTHGARVRPKHIQMYLQKWKHAGVAGRIPNEPVRSAPGGQLTPNRNPSLS